MYTNEHSQGAKSGHLASFVGDAHFLDHAGIFGELIPRQGAEFLRRAAAHGKAELLELAADLHITDGSHDFGVETGDDFFRRPGWREYRKPGVEEEARQT